MRVLFVCTGNTCRSPMAEGIYNSLSEGAFSRGLMAEGGNASVNAIKAVKKLGIDISKHASRQLTIEDIDEADLVLTMTEGHKRAILNAVPDTDKVFTIGEYAGKSDVSDPYGSTEEVYEACAKQLWEYIEIIIGMTK